MTEVNKPVCTVRDGVLKMSIWENYSSNGTFYTATPAKTFEKNGELHDTHSFSPHELLRLAELARQSYCTIAELRTAPRSEC